MISQQKTGILWCCVHFLKIPNFSFHKTYKRCAEKSINGINLMISVNVPCYWLYAIRPLIKVGVKYWNTLSKDSSQNLLKVIETPKRKPIGCNKIK